MARTPRATTSEDEQPPSPGIPTITVETGDTWEKLAERAGCDVDDLVGANIDLSRPGQRPPLRVTQVLYLP